MGSALRKPIIALVVVAAGSIAVTYWRNATRATPSSASLDAASLPPASGPAQSKVYVLIYSDFACPVCARAAPDTRRIVDEWPGEVRFEFHQLAPASHSDAESAAAAALAAHRQGKFWEMHDLLFANQGRFDADSLQQYAQQLGLDMERYDKDFADAGLRQRIAEESEEAHVFGAGGTPSFVVNGQVLVGWGSWNGYRNQVQEELKAVNALLAEGVPLREAHERRAREVLKDANAFALWNDLVIRRVGATSDG